MPSGAVSSQTFQSISKNLGRYVFGGCDCAGSLKEIAIDPWRVRVEERAECGYIALSLGDQGIFIIRQRCRLGV